jgi:uncharacterized protein YdaU (DUF1376 family)
MGRFSPIKVNYVALYFRDWIVALYRMSTMERGIYDSLVFHIYEAGGRLENKTSLLASLSGLSELEFTSHWSTLKRKFVQEGNFISHKRCMIELRKTDTLTKSRQKGGLTSAKTRKEKGIESFVKKEVTSKSVRTDFEQLNNTKLNNTINTKDGNHTNSIYHKVLDNISETNNSKVFNSFSAKDKSSLESDKLALYGALSNFLVLQQQSQRTCLSNICKWAVNHPEAGKEFYRRMIDFADEAKRKAKTNRWGYFLGGLRRQLGYVPGKVQE